MKIHPKRLARAIVESMEGLTPKQLPTLVEAIAHVLEKNGQLRLMRMLPQYIEEAYHASQGILPLGITLPSDDLASVKPLVKAVEEKLDVRADIRLRVRPALIGGAQLTLKDERFDASIQTALQSALTHLSGL
jgi:F0F1-type ATP synthase delta subunit